MFYLQLPFSYLCANWPLQVSMSRDFFLLIALCVRAFVCVCAIRMYLNEPPPALNISQGVFDRFVKFECWVHSTRSKVS